MRRCPRRRVAVPRVRRGPQKVSLPFDMPDQSACRATRRVLLMQFKSARAAPVQTAGAAMGGSSSTSTVLHSCFDVTTTHCAVRSSRRLMLPTLVIGAFDPNDRGELNRGVLRTKGLCATFATLFATQARPFNDV